MSNNKDEFEKMQEDHEPKKEHLDFLALGERVSKLEEKIDFFDNLLSNVEKAVHDIKKRLKLY